MKKSNKFKTTLEESSLKLAIDFLLETYFLILVICHFDNKIGVSIGYEKTPYIVIFFYITMKKNGYQTLKRKIFKGRIILEIRAKNKREGISFSEALRSDLSVLNKKNKFRGVVEFVYPIWTVIFH